MPVAETGPRVLAVRPDRRDGGGGRADGRWSGPQAHPADRLARQSGPRAASLFGYARHPRGCSVESRSATAVDHDGHGVESDAVGPPPRRVRREPRHGEPSRPVALRGRLSDSSGSRPPLRRVLTSTKASVVASATIRSISPWAFFGWAPPIGSRAADSARARAARPARRAPGWPCAPRNAPWAAPCAPCRWSGGPARSGDRVEAPSPTTPTTGHSAGHTRREAGSALRSPSSYPAPAVMIGVLVRAHGFAIKRSRRHVLVELDAEWSSVVLGHRPRRRRGA